jgi:hypothetical protein
VSLLLPRMPSEPPPGYVDFVERHLDALREDAARVVGDERDADQLYPEVLTDIAARWRWLRRPEARERYLRQAFQRRSQRWESEQVWPVEMEIEVGPVYADPDEPFVVRRTAAPAWSSIALRLAPHLESTRRVEVKPIAEAAVAWWHAYAAHRRRRVMAVLGFLFLILMVVARLQQSTY